MKATITRALGRGVLWVSLIVAPVKDAAAGLQGFRFLQYLGGGVIGASVGDFDGDGFFDVLTHGTPQLYLNQGGTNFVAVASGLTNAPAGGIVAMGDLDRDGDLDLWLSGPNRVGANSALFANRGDGSYLLLPDAGLPRLTYGAAAWGDADGDGDLDLLLTGSTNATAVGRSRSLLELSQGSQRFLTHPVKLPGLQEGVATWLDYNGDGLMDFLVCGLATPGGGPATLLYRGTESGDFLPVETPFPGVWRAGVDWGDIDNDGDLDVVIAGNRGTVRGQIGVAQIFRNDGPAGFTDLHVELPQVWDASARWGDCDGDGDLDLMLGGISLRAFGGTQGNSRVFLNQGDGTFSELVANLPGIGQGAAEWADFDNDGRLDVMLNWDGYTRVYRNTSLGTNTPPDAPTDLQARQVGSNIEFRWLPAADPNQKAGLSYNLRVGTAPGRADILAPMADVKSGQRRVARLGNTGLRTRWTLRDLPRGTYYWSVQAIDHSYAGSAFAAEAMLEILEGPPVVSVAPATNLSATGALLVGQVHPNGLPTSSFFEFGTNSEFGGLTVSEPVASDASSTAASAVLAGLLPSTPYTYRLVASNAAGIARSRALGFVTSRTAPFTEMPTGFLTTRADALFVVDVDGDGELDVVGTGGVPTDPFGAVTIFHLNHRGMFAPTTNAMPYLAPGADWGDADNDSRLDVAGRFKFDWSLNSQLWLQRSEGAFSQATRVRWPLHGDLQIGAHFVDLDNDGDLDLVAAGSSATLLLRNLGAGVFAPWEVPLDWGGGHADWGDFDNDGDMDLLLSDHQQRLQIARNDGPEGFHFVAPPLPWAELWVTEAAWGDWDGDGDLDVAFAGSARGNTSRRVNAIYRNDGPAGFVDLLAPLGSGGFLSLIWADLVGDANLDLLLVGPGSALFRNAGNGQFVAVPLDLPVMVGRDGRIGDLDGDGALDLVMLAAPNIDSGARIRWFRNNGEAASAPPAAPAQLRATVQDHEVELGWSMPAQGPGPAVAGFNLRVGVSPGGSEIMSPMADLRSGRRFVVQRGNAGQRGTWRIKNLLPGRYFWSVQSLDGRWAGSLFSPEAEFEIADTPNRALRITWASVVPQNSVEELHLRLEGPRRARVLIERSGDLVTWVTDPSAVVGLEEGVVTFVLPLNPAEAQGFLRLRTDDQTAPF